MRSVKGLSAGHLGNYVETVTQIQLPFTLGSLEDKPNQNQKEMEKVCQERLGANQPAQCMSASFIDSEGRPVLFYFGDRIVLAEGESRVSKILG
jgi:hypothetical protein